MALIAVLCDHPPPSAACRCFPLISLFFQIHTIHAPCVSYYSHYLGNTMYRTSKRRSNTRCSRLCLGALVLSVSLQLSSIHGGWCKFGTKEWQESRVLVRDWENRGS
ncbi:hypothetical protein BJX96DRAFT_148720, partial [Aspergillus floccosus]